MLKQVMWRSKYTAGKVAVKMAATVLEANFTEQTKCTTKLVLMVLQDQRAHNLQPAAPVAEWLRALIFHYSTLPFDHLTAVTGVGLSPALATCETSQTLLAGVSGGFSRGSPVFAPPTDRPVSYELK